MVSSYEIKQNIEQSNPESDVRPDVVHDTSDGAVSVVRFVCNCDPTGVNSAVDWGLPGSTSIGCAAEFVVDALWNHRHLTAVTARKPTPSGVGGSA